MRVHGLPSIHPSLSGLLVLNALAININSSESRSHPAAPSTALIKRGSYVWVTRLFSFSPQSITGYLPHHMAKYCS